MVDNARWNRFIASKIKVDLQGAEALDVLVANVEPETVEVLVYEGGLFIEIFADGRYFLALENYSWVSPETSLETMEAELFQFSLEYNGE